MEALSRSLNNYAAVVVFSGEMSTDDDLPFMPGQLAGTRRHDRARWTWSSRSLDARRQQS